MAGITTAFLTSFKSDLFSALHCFNATVVKTGVNGTSGQFGLTGLANVTGLAVGMAVSGTNIAAGAVVASIDSSTTCTLSKAHTGTISSGSITFTGDVFKVALIKSGMAGTYGASTTNYTDVTGNSDEASGTGYTAGGQALAGQASPTISGTTAFVDWTTDPSWTSATLSVAGMIIYNTSQRGPTATRAMSVHDFGGTQSVTAGTFTVVLPTADSSNAILRIG
ncbi:MAG TPA: hypothetical protein VKT73_13215 [Xanthobacteraceae bacterium]|nr:hypothetical protein [Xanthobacteraceae bacterium]